MKPAAIVGWTGNGSLDDLERTAVSKFLTGRIGVARGTRALIVSGEDPVLVAGKLSHLPGAAWIAVGFEFDGLEACMSRLAQLAGRYLRAGASFKVSAEVERSGKEEGDVLFEATSTLLKAVKGSHVDESNPNVWFRVIMVADRGACGVQLREGPGGVPSSKKMTASCLVSGGYHSAVTAWMASLTGFSLTLVHARDDDESLRQVARLYAELSHRTDASTLGLEVLEGEAPAGNRVAAWLGRARGEVFTGVHPECRGTGGMDLLRRYPAVQFPLLLLQEREIRVRFEDLRLRAKQADRGASLRISSGNARYTVRRFGHREADLNAVLDSLMA